MARILNLTHSRQETETGCLEACVQMALRYLGIDRSQADLARQMDATPHIGTVSRNVLNLQSSTLQVISAEGTLELMRGWLERDVPVIAFVQTLELPYWDDTEARHAVVVVGIDEEDVYLLDPARDPDVIPVSLGDFTLAWEDWMEGRYAVITHSDQS